MQPHGKGRVRKQKEFHQCLKCTASCRSDGKRPICKKCQRNSVVRYHFFEINHIPAARRGLYY